MGFRYFYILDECRDMCGYTDTGSIAFAAAALGVEMDIKT
jgi:microtubule-associated protein-like 6